MTIQKNHKSKLFGTFFFVNLLVACIYWGYSYGVTQVTPFYISGYSAEYLLGWWYFLFALAFGCVYLSTYVRERFLVVLLLASALILFSWPFTSVFLDKRYLFSNGYDDGLTRLTAIVDILNLGLILQTAFWIATRKMFGRLT